MSTAATATNARPEGESILDPIDAFLNQTDINLELTYGFAPETIVFPVRIMMADDEIEARQKFYLQPAEAQTSGRHKYQVDLLSSLLSGRPKGLPGFSEITGNVNGPAAALKEYLMRGGPIAEKIATDALDQYNRRTNPAEFFR